MKLVISLLSVVLLAAPLSGQEPGWISLWDGKTFDGWKKADENPDSFRIEDGAIIANGPRSHLFYVGDVNDGVFKNFEFKVDVMTKASSNGGIYVHTAYQESGWPLQGFEIQVNNSHRDWRRSGSIYEVQNVREVPTKDDEWFTEHIVVQGKRIAVFLNGEKVADWEQPDDWTPPGNMTGRFIQVNGGTVGFQAHDPGSRVAYKNIRIKPLD